MKVPLPDRSRFVSGCRLVSVVATVAGVDLADLGDHPLPRLVVHVQDLREAPVQVVADVRDLLPQPIGRVRHDPPGASPAMSTANSWPQCGQATATSACPSWLIRRYRSCRNARSEANRFSTRNASMSRTSPSRVMV